MNVIVDTSAWSVLLRRIPGSLTEPQRRVRREVAQLVREGRVGMLGPVRQELLSGIRHQEQFVRLRAELRAHEDVAIMRDDYETAAQISNQCRSAGLQGSAVDFLICAIALGHDWPIFTTDMDFARYQRILPIQLHQAR